MPAARGVYYRPEDYASFWIRAVVDLIDLLVFAALCAALLVPAVILASGLALLNSMCLIAVSVAFAYFVVLKRSRFRTLGYRIGRVRIVGLDGQPPGYGALTLRLAFAMLGPLNWLIDLFWLFSDGDRQALRDKVANTYVIRKDAQPAGTGRIVFRHYDIASYNCLFREVERSSSASV